MSNVVTLPSSTSQLQSFIQDWLARRQQQQQSEAMMKQNQSQFDASHALDVQRTDAQAGLMGAQTEGAKSQTSIEAAKAKVQGFVENTIKPLVANGQADKAAQLTQAFIRSNPDTAIVLQGYASERPQLPSDTAAANTQKYAADQTGIAAGTSTNSAPSGGWPADQAFSGANAVRPEASQDVQARAFTQELALGRPMSPHQFADQAQRQPEAGDQSTPYGKTLAIEGQRKPTANAQLQADTQIQIGREHNEAAQTMASGRAVGRFTTLTDQVGRVVGFYNESTGEFKPAPVEGLRKGPIPTGERDTAANAEGMVTDLARAKELAGKYENRIGPFMGRATAAESSVVSVDPELNELQQIVTSLKNRLLYLKSGKQINESEYKRLSGTLPDMTQPKSRFYANLERMQTEMGQVVARNAALVPNGSNKSGGGTSPGGTVIKYDESGKRIQ